MPIPFSGCYVYMGALRGGGYGAISVDDRLRPAHVVAYEILVGPVPDGLELDHKCRVPSCWNPNHLEPVTHTENVRRGVGGEHCPAGHLYDEANTHINSQGSRVCRACRRERHRVYMREYRTRQEHPTEKSGVWQ
jgi:hypothetical protein